MTTKILIGDALEQLAGLPDESVQCCVTSPPYYGLRCYNTEGQIGLEATPEAHIARLVEVFREVKRVLRKDGVLWLNYGDAYAASGSNSAVSNSAHDGGVWKSGEFKDGFRNSAKYQGQPSRSTVGHGAKPKDLLMMPARVALALQADGWWLRSMMPWVKRSAMPESATDRPATAVEYVFMLTKSARYFYDAEAARQAHDPNSPFWRTHPQGQKSVNRTNRLDGSNDAAPNKHLKDLSPHAGRNFRNSDLFFSSLQEPYGLISDAEGKPLALDVNPAGFAEAHFATFSPKLIEPLIKAATSEKGCCPDCGAPWVREVERTAGDTESADRPKAVGHAGYGSSTSTLSLSGQGSKEWAERGSRTKTLGWSPSCSCCCACDAVGVSSEDAPQRPDTRESLAVGLEQETLGRPRTSRKIAGEQKQTRDRMQKVRKNCQETEGDEILQPKLLGSLDERERSSQLLPEGGQRKVQIGLAQREAGARASCGDGASSRSGTPAVGIGSSHKRDTRRQPDRKSSSSDQVGTCEDPHQAEKGHQLVPYPCAPCVILDPFGGAGTTGLVADRLGRDCILIELNPNYAEMARKRISGDAPLFAEVQT